MQPGSLRTLEFNRVVEALATFALTPLGRVRLTKLTPSTEAAKVAELLASTSETARYLSVNPMLPLRATADLPRLLESLAIEGRALEPLRLLALSDFLDSVDEARTAIRRVAGAFPMLEGASGSAASFKRETVQVREKIDPSGEVVDQASADLKLIRDRLRKQRTRLRGTLESYLRGKETSKYLQDQVVTERNGRFVLVVRAEHRNAIPGIVHGASTSGASLFLEPLSTVEINNDIVALEEQETQEVRRILLMLTNAFRGRPLDLYRTVETATELDVLQARAQFSRAMDGTEPTLSFDGAFELQAARHPLLMPHVIELLRRAEPPTEGAAAAPPGRPPDAPGPVPVTIKVLPPKTCLLITGPNTGGKTVALKTAGLLALMAQAGLHVPAAEGSRLPVFRSFFADIGDEQSIDRSLSTFSAHIANIAAMDRHLVEPALILLDEVGSGTDPAEGGALGVAIVDYFRRRGATVIATSHYDALKTYASTTDGVEGAAFGFHPDTFAPTYELVYGSPGRSLALEIAGRLGLNPSVISAARANVSQREAQLAEHLAKIDHDMRAIEHEHRLATRERETLEADEAKMRLREEALRQKEETFRQRLNEEIGVKVREARREIDDVIARLKTRTTVALETGRALSSGESGEMRGDARAAVEAVAKKMLEPLDEPPAPGPIGRPPEVGDRVVVGGLGLEGVVTGIHDGTADLDVRGKRLRANVRDLHVVGTTAQVGRVNVNVHLQPRESVLSDLNVVGCTVDEALARAERFLDESLLGDQRVVRVIHGYGTGQLKRALSGFLQQHPLVARFQAAPPEQGGGGVTVVELKD
jgi:DNA mismatch repair protein MutS2